MNLTEEDKTRIHEEEAYRQKLREENAYRTQLNKPTTKSKSSNSKKILLAIIIGFFILIILANIAALSTKSTSNTSTQPSSSSENSVIEVETIPVQELINLKQAEVEAKYAELITDYNNFGKLPSKKVIMTGFDLPKSKANVQVDYLVATGKPIYIGYSFSENPLPEKYAWQVTGYPKLDNSLAVGDVTDTSIRNYHWENIAQIKPFKKVQIIYLPKTAERNLVGKISFSFRDTEEVNSPDSPYNID